MLKPARSTCLIIIALVVALAAAVYWKWIPPLDTALGLTSQTTPSDPIGDAWARARERGSYHFDGDMTQVTLPSAIPANVGRTSKTEQFYLDGRSDLHNGGLEMKLWNSGGSVAQDATAVGVKVQDGKTYIRQGTGEWTENATFSTDSFAPQGDFLAFLKAVRDVKPVGTETRAGITFSRYAFQIDGPAFAAWARDQMEISLHQKGQLPAGSRLTIPSYFRDMTGEGELWVRESGTQAGLPLRQILTLRFPEQRNQSVQAQIKIDFSEFGPVTPNGLQGTLTHIRNGLPNPSILILTLLALIAIGLLIRFHGSPRLQRALVVALTVMLMANSPLEGIRQLSLLNAQTAQAATHEKAQTEAERMAELRSQDAKTVFNPHLNPLDAANQRDAARAKAASVMAAMLPAALPAASSFSTGAQAPLAAPLAQTAVMTTDNGLDTDQDGLTDFAELRIGTVTNTVDTDYDEVPDAVEARGFLLGGSTWYLDSNIADSNDDGILDGQECWQTAPAADLPANQVPPCNLDTDTDGMPDVFDDDNDGDGVIDRLDLTPSATGSSVYNDASPLQLTLNNLQAGAPTFVNFQIRPVNPQHLWYAFNVLDWPIDTEGQVIDEDNKTWADVARAQGRDPEASASYGDMKLIPMLEIRVTGPITNLPSASDLMPYSINVSNYTPDGSTRIIYVPLTIVSDQKTGARVAFSGLMRYLPGGSWPSPHDMRLVWAVQALQDVPCNPAAPDAAQQGCTQDGYIYNQPQVIQTYYDDFRLAGLTVSEDYGAKTALVYEDPTVDPNLKADDALAAISAGLDYSFLSGRDQDTNGQRDVDIDEIARRFNHASNASVPSEQRWGLGNGNAINILNVERHDYTLFDQATAFTTMTETKTLLNDKFEAAWTADNDVVPTILYAYERQLRSVSLEGGSAYSTLNGNALTMDMRTGTDRAALNTIVGVKWTHYCRDGASSPWEMCDAADYWQRLDALLGTGQLPNTPNTPDANDANKFFALMYDQILSGGIDRAVQTDSALVSSRYSQVSDSNTETAVRGAANVSGLTIAAIANYHYISSFDQTVFAARMYRIPLNGVPEGTETLPQWVRNMRGSLSNSRLKGAGAALGLVTVLGGLAVAAYYDSQGKREAGAAIRAFVLTVQIVINVVLPILTVRAWQSGLSGGVGLSKILTGKSELLGNAAKANKIGAAIAIAITWGFFIYSVASSDVEPFSPEFNKALAETIAATIYILVLTVLSATVVGAIIVGIIGAIDAILTAVCELGVSELRNVPGQDGACFTLGTATIKFIAKQFYNYDLMVNTNRSDLVKPGNPQTNLADPSKGLVEGNPLSISIPVTTHAVHKSPDLNNGTYILEHMSLFSRDNLKSSTFKYTLTQPDAQTVSAGRGQMSSQWQNVAKNHTYQGTTLYGGYAYTTAGPVTFNLEAGLNRNSAFYLNMGYAIPAYECWGVPLLFITINDCSTRTNSGNTSSYIDRIKYDIFPATLDGFMALGSKLDSGLGLRWDPAFPSLFDADGDGVPSSVHGGLDISDGSWDIDQDGLSDAKEVDLRAKGFAFSPIACDSDNDGLTDAQESALGTNPGIADTDNDGLKDSVEVWHQVFTACASTSAWAGGWDIPINALTPFVTHVSSNPGADDSDNDGISDQAELELSNNSDPVKRVDDQNRPYNPNIYNSSPIKVYPSSDRRFVAPGSSVIYTTTVIATVALSASVLDVTAPGVLGGVQAPDSLPFNPLTFSNAQSITRQTTLNVQAGIPAQQIALTSTVRARLAPTRTATLTWDPVTLQVMDNIQSNQIVFNRVVAALPDRQDAFLMAGVTSDEGNSERGGNGDIRMYSIPAGPATILDNGTNNTTARRGQYTPEPACNNFGTCMVVWEEMLIPSNINSIKGAIVNPNGSLQRIVTIPNLTSPLQTNAHRYRPVVATDGTTFMVASELASTSQSRTYISLQKFDSAGNQIASTLNLIDPARPIARVLVTDHGTEFAIVWMRDRFRLAFVQASTDVHTHKLKVVDINPTTAAMMGEPIEVQTPSLFFDTKPDFAYDPNSDRTLLMWVAADNYAHYQLWQGPDITAPVVPSHDFGLPGTFRAEYQPFLNAWLITDGFYYLWKLDMSSTLSGIANGNPFGINGYGSQLACPKPESLPVIDLRFEDQPGSFSFVDSSLKANNASCSDTLSCPIAGVAAATDASGNAVGTPSSDYAISFRGGGAERLNMPNPLKDSFSFAFWYKSAPSADPNGVYIDGGLSGGFSFFIYNAAPFIELRSGSSTVQANRNLNDNAWHYVVATRNAFTGAMAIYVDGNATPVGSVSSSVAPVMPATMALRALRPASIDQFQVYSVPFSGSTVQALYTRTAQSYCAAGLGGQTPSWHTLNAYYPDVRGGKITSSGSLSLTVDADTPTSTLVGLSNNQYIKGNQTLIIGGNANDQTSGVTGVEVNINNAGFQPTTGSAAWAYNLTVGEGAYTIQTRATDIAGNVETLSAASTVIADATAPNVAIAALSATPIKPTRDANGNWSVVLNGTASDPVAGGHPGSGLQPNAVQVLLKGQDGDALGNGWQAATLSGNNWTIDYVFSSGLPDPTGSYTVSARAVDKVGNATADDASTATLQLDATGPDVALNEGDAIRQLITDTLTIGGVITETGVAGLDKLEIAFTPVEQIAALPAAITSEQAEALLQRPWVPVALTQRGAGVTQTTWSVQVPVGLENMYQIDLRSTDMLGNQQLSSKMWRGVVDNFAPRTAITASLTGNSYVDVHSQVRYYETTYTCAAVDQYLDDATFACAGNALQPPTRAFTSNAAVQALFPDITIRVGMFNTYTLWQTSTVPLATTRACDGYGHCTTASTQPVAALNNSDTLIAAAHGAMESDFQAIPASQASLALPTSIVIAPTQGSYVASATGGIRVTSVARTEQPLKELALSLDGIVVATIPFAQSAGITQTQATIAVTPTSEGAHTVFAQVTDWAGHVQATPFPVTFKLDRQPPTVTLDTDALTMSDTWGAGSGVLRFRGTASDTVGLAAVQIKVGDLDYEDVTIANGTWSTAVPVNDPEGKTLAVIVRAIDFTGQTSTQSASIGTNLSSNDAPETGITSSPLFNSISNTATFSFTGASNVRDVPAFECQLDSGSFVPCVSPYDLVDLSNGPHVFHVRAVDSDGNVDLTPANYAWNVDVAALKTTISGAPATTSTTRSATFVFSGATGSTGFECALDGAAFVSCTSPQTFANLDYGDHTLDVRANNGAGSTGAPTHFAWTVVNTPPVAANQHLSMVGGNVLSITLGVTDVDTLTYQLGTPTHGVLQGIPPALIYIPDTGYYGPDHFTFSANDGLATSNVATISITVIPPDQTPPTTSITLLAAIATGANGWYTSSVGVVVSATDGVDPRASGVGQTRCGLDLVPAPTTFAELATGCAYTGTGGSVATDGAHNVYAASIDLVGNASVPVSKTFKIDRTAPVVSLTGVLSGATYLLGAVPVAACVTADPTSGVAVSSTLSTTGANAHGTGRLTSMCSSATDMAGNKSAVVSARYTVTYDAKTFVVLAKEGINFDQAGTIARGSVGVNLSTTGPFLAGNVELKLSQKFVMQDAASRILANRITVDQGSTLINPGYNTLTGSPTVQGTRATSVTLPLVANFPVLPTFTAGTQALAFKQNTKTTLASGSYAALTADQNNEITFSGGVYTFASWKLGQNAKLYFAAPTEIRIVGRVQFDQNVLIGAAPGKSVTASQIVIYVAGQNGSNGAITASPKAVQVGQNAVINANVIAPNGTVQLDQKARVTGAIIGRWVNVSQNATMKLESALP